jgi:hypothetical protein
MIRITSGGCTADYQYHGLCSTASYNKADLDPAYQYIQDTVDSTKVWAGSSETHDYCPHVLAYSNGDCRVEENFREWHEHYGREFGPSSTCVYSTLVGVDYSYQGYGPMDAGCYRTRCTPDNKVTITVVSVHAGAQNVTCDYDGQELAVAGFNGHITCPPAAMTCRHVCPKLCSARGTCYSVDGGGGACDCDPGYTGADCSLPADPTTSPTACEWAPSEASADSVLDPCNVRLTLTCCVATLCTWIPSAYSSYQCR